jgi:predicted hydrolase (HD superfamily)
VEHVPWARELARRLLADSLPRRWAHTQGVGRKAESIAHVVGDEADILIGAAWLHDIGYAPGLTKTGFHPLDGARYLRDVEKTDDPICRLVAHHSCAIIEARNRELAAELAAEFPAVDGLLADALTFCDMTISPDGDTVDVETRLREILLRYDTADIVAKSVREAWPQIVGSVRKLVDHFSILDP